MISAGIDMGAKTVKAVILKENKILSKSMILTGFDQNASAEKVFSEALQIAGLSRNELGSVTATGMGKEVIYLKPPINANNETTMVGADAKGVISLFPSARTVVDVGAEEGRAARIDAQGKVIDFAINEKCAAGAGTFTEAMARALEVDLEEFGRLSLKSTKTIPMNAQCAVFSESEVVSLVHARTEKADIAKAVHDAIAGRIASMVRRVGIEKDIVLIGGVAKNPGFVDALRRTLEVGILVPEDPEYIGALGAALSFTEKNGGV